jgi:hypothetical protein
MIFPEIFYLHIQGKQHGPYTIPQIDHLLNSGLIAQETLYWREGLDQWQPVTEIVALRKRGNPWIKPAIAVGVALIVLAVLRVFGPVALMGWHEANQHEYTARAAYWRARETVRNHHLPPGSLVEFAPFEKADVQLSPPALADVVLRAEVTGSDGKIQTASWRVAMNYDADSREWTGGATQNLPPPP